MTSEERAVAALEPQEGVPSATDTTEGHQSEGHLEASLQAPVPHAGAEPCAAPVAADDAFQAPAGEPEAADELDDVPIEAEALLQADSPREAESTMCLRPERWSLVPSSQAVESQISLGHNSAQYDRVITIYALQAMRLATFGAVCMATGYDLDDSMIDDSCHSIAPGMPCFSTKASSSVDLLAHFPEMDTFGRSQVSSLAPESWGPILAMENIGCGS